MKLPIILVTMAVSGLIAGVLLSVLILDGGVRTSDITLGSFHVRSANAAGQPRFSEQAAEEAARAAAGQRLGETISGLASFNGRAINASDLSVVGSVFAPAAVEVSSSVSTFRFKTQPPADLWIFIYRAAPVAMPDWGITDGVVEVQIVVNDATGSIESANVLRYNPNAG